MLQERKSISFLRTLRASFLNSDETSFCPVSKEFRALWATDEKATIVHLAWLFLQSPDSKIFLNVGTVPQFRVGLSRLFFDTWATAEEERIFRIAFLDFSINYYSQI